MSFRKRCHECIEIFKILQKVMPNVIDIVKYDCLIMKIYIKRRVHTCQN